jgi:hypothetical protein
VADEAPQIPAPGPAPASTPTSAISPEDLAGLLVASGIPSPDSPPSKSALRRKLLFAGLIAGIGLGASVMSCVGQSFSYRQAHALEGIEQQLKEIRASCSATPVVREKSSQ